MPLCRRSGTQKGTTAAALTRELLGPYLLQMGAQRLGRGWMLAPCFIGGTFTRRGGAQYTLHSCQKKSKGAAAMLRASSPVDGGGRIVDVDPSIGVQDFAAPAVLEVCSLLSGFS